MTSPTPFSHGFSAAALTASEYAARNEIENNIPFELMPNAIQLSRFLSNLQYELYAKYGSRGKLHLTSGYRCGELNTAIGGVPDSDHCKCLAGDLVAEGLTPKELFGFIRANCPDCRQVICEFDKWVHIGLRAQGDKRPREYLIAKKVDKKTVYEVAK